MLCLIFINLCQEYSSLPREIQSVYKLILAHQNFLSRDSKSNDMKAIESSTISTLPCVDLVVWLDFWSLDINPSPTLAQILQHNLIQTHNFPKEIAEMVCDYASEVTYLSARKIGQARLKRGVKWIQRAFYSHHTIIYKPSFSSSFPVDEEKELWNMLEVDSALCGGTLHACYHAAEYSRTPFSHCNNAFEVTHPSLAPY